MRNTLRARLSFISFSKRRAESRSRSRCNNVAECHRSNVEACRVWQAAPAGPHRTIFAHSARLLPRHLAQEGSLDVATKLPEGDDTYSRYGRQRASSTFAQGVAHSMNLFVAGPHALSDWVLQMIEDTKDQLLGHTPPIFLKVTPEVGSADAVIYEADHREQIDSNDEYGGLARLCIVEPGSEIHRSQQETLLFRRSRESDPAWLKARFEEAMRTIFLQCHLHAFQRTLSGPFSHDVRGALSVVSLSRQLLESGGGGKMVAERLGRVDSRIAMALFDIEARSLCLSGAWPPSTENAQTGAPRIDEISDWFKRTQGDRELQTSDTAQDELRRAPSWLALALAGVIDGVTRLTRGRVEILANEKGDTSFCVRVMGEGAALDENQVQCLEEPERWPLMSSHVLPYRLGTAALIVDAGGGSVVARAHDGYLTVELRLP